MSGAYEYILVRLWEVRSQVPGTTFNGARTNSSINNTQASSYIRAPKGVAQYLGLEKHRTEVPKYQSTAPSRWRHNKYYIKSVIVDSTS